MQHVVRSGSSLLLKEWDEQCQVKWRDLVREQLKMTIKFGENVIMDPKKSNFSGVLRVGAINSTDDVQMLDKLV